MDLRTIAVPFGILGLGFLATSFVQLGFCKPRKIFLWIGAFLVALAVVGAFQIIRSPPVDGDTVDETTPDVPVVPSTLPAIKRLQQEWDSEERAAWPVAGTLAKISDLAYLPPVDAIEEFRNQGFSEYMPIVAGSMIGYVVSHDDVTVVVFRGTDFGETSDWLANISTSFERTEHGGIHSGFYQAYLALQPQIEKLLGQRKSKHLWITGHSLGGALALVCAYDLTKAGRYNVDGVITFGQPMIARQDLASHIDQVLIGRLARFVNDEDMVPRVPPGYAPCGSLIWFTSTGIRRSKPKRMMFSTSADDNPPLVEDAEVPPMTEREFRMFQNELRGKQPMRMQQRTDASGQQYGAGPIEDHSMQLYVEKVRQILGE